jgi:uncharacterized metal-binding protein
MTSWLRIMVVVVLGVLTFLALFPFYGVDTQPPVHWSVFGNQVPADSPWLAVAVGVLVAAVTWVLSGRLRGKGRTR